MDKIDVNVASKPLTLETLFGAMSKDKKANPPAQGTVQLQIDAHGSLSKITADVKLAGRSLRSPQTPTLRPADADVDLTLKDQPAESRHRRPPAADRAVDDQGQHTAGPPGHCRQQAV